MPLLPLIFVALLVLKVIGVLAISWLVVFSPLIIAAALFVLALVLMLLGLSIGAIATGLKLKPTRIERPRPIKDLY